MPNEPTPPLVVTDTMLDAACAAYLACVEGFPQRDAVGLWRDWRLQPAAGGYQIAIEALADDRRAMRAALAAAFAEIKNGE